MIFPGGFQGLSQEAQQDTGRDGGADDTGYVRAHGMHEQVVVLVEFTADDLGYAGAVRYGGYASVADQRVDLASFAEEQVDELHEEHTCRRSDDEGEQTESEDQQGFAGQELVRLGGRTDGQADQDRNDVHERTAGGFCETAGDAAFLQEVTEEEHAEQRKTGRDDECGDEEADDREDDLFLLADLARIRHADEAFLLGRQGQHDRTLDDRDQGHVGVGGDGDGAHQVRSQFGTQEDGGRTVRAADDTDGAGFIGCEPEGKGEQIGSEDTHLGSRTDQDQPGLRDQRGKVRHRTDAQEDQRRVPAHLDALIQGVEDGAVLVDADVETREHRDVADDHAEADRDEEQRLPFLEDGHGDEGNADGDHGNVLPGHVGKARVLPELLQTADDLIHVLRRWLRCRHLPGRNRPWRHG